MGKEKGKIRCPHLILCEGIDAYYFLIHFLGKLCDTETELNKFQVMDFGGNEQLNIFLDTMPKLPNYDTVKSILIIRDSESNFDSAFKSIQNSLEQAGYAVPASPCEIKEQSNIQVCFALFPSLSEDKATGTLEDLCIKNLSEQNASEILNDIDSFFEKLEKVHDRKFPHRHKSKLHTYLSVTDKYVTLKLGEAAKAGAYSFDGVELQNLRRLLLAIAQPRSHQ